MEILTKHESETNPEYGCNPEKRPIKQLIEYGMININKVQGPTSHQVADYVKRILQVSKAGHSGTLDPNVTGVLPIACAKATRVAGMLLKSPKEYVALMHIHQKIPEAEIKKMFEQFKGKIKQTPPRKSAVKRQERERMIHALDILEIQDQEVLFRVSCQAGTYIRTLIHQMGLYLKTGAHMTQLIRTKTGPFTYKTWHSLQDLKDAYEYYKQGDETEIRTMMHPFEIVVENMPRIWIHDSAVNTLCHGSSLGVPGIARVTANINPKDTVAILTLKGECVCFGTAVLSSKDMIEKEKGLAATTHTVFMERNIYPSPNKKI